MKKLLHPLFACSNFNAGKIQLFNRPVIKYGLKSIALAGIFMMMCVVNVNKSHAQFNPWHLTPDWASCVGPFSHYQEIHSSVLHSDGYIYAVGYSVLAGNHDFLLTKFSTAGNEVFFVNPVFSSSSDILHGIAEAFDGTLVAVGVVGNHSTNFPQCIYRGKGDIVVIRFNQHNGEILDIKTIGGSEIDRAYCVATSPDGSIIIGGKTASTDFDFAGTTAYGGEDAVAICLDYNFNVQWIQRVGGDGQDRFNRVLISRDETFLLAGSYFQNDKRIGLFCKINPLTGSIYTQKLYDTESNINEITGIAENPQTGELYLTGNDYENSTLSPGTPCKPFLIKTTFNGTQLKRVEAHHSKMRSFRDIIIVNNKLYIAGEMQLALRDPGIFVYDTDLNYLNAAGYYTYAINDNPRSIMHNGESFFMAGIAYGNEYMSQYYSNSYENIVYDGFILRVNANEISEISENSDVSAVRIFPNPVIDVVYFELISNENEYTIEIINTGGQLVFSDTFFSNEVNIDLGHLPAGMYVYVINKTIRGKLIKQ